MGVCVRWACVVAIWAAALERGAAAASAGHCAAENAGAAFVSQRGRGIGSRVLKELCCLVPMILGAGLNEAPSLHTPTRLGVACPLCLPY